MLCCFTVCYVMLCYVMKDRLDGNDYVGMIGTLLSSMLCHVPYVTLLALFVVVLLYVML